MNKIQGNILFAINGSGGGLQTCTIDPITLDCTFKPAMTSRK